MLTGTTSRLVEPRATATGPTVVVVADYWPIEPRADDSLYLGLITLRAHLDEFGVLPVASRTDATRVVLDFREWLPAVVRSLTELRTGRRAMIGNVTASLCSVAVGIDEDRLLTAVGHEVAVGTHRTRVEPTTERGQ